MTDFAMHLEHPAPISERTVKCRLSDESKVIVRRSQRLTATTTIHDGDEELGRLSTCIGLSQHMMLICIASSSGTAKLEAVKRLHVLPGLSSAEDQSMLDPRIEAYELE